MATIFRKFIKVELIVIFWWKLLEKSVNEFEFVDKKQHPTIKELDIIG